MLTFILECGFYFYGIVHVLMLKQARQAKYTPTPSTPTPPTARLSPYRGRRQAALHWLHTDTRGPTLLER